ncbi:MULTISPECIES: DUF1120 domain-containing protein [unclassified Pseudomonas]|uniref:DUF1120 domain-containing protein n=1 Tax=unclassified Pseudomonas TaxID=196821 RepID=UPI002AC8B2B9|nr:MULTISPECIES: DUF1120 domain-containing protein [unclassified Pseudomonas]MEB0044373.1 DUF1120 domain-containing protein [Pseudomonas sp. Dout3]MEB0094690.1 DUF1120 domain-containing protein [Pseudomonas sp. DC1.2]WPX59942.1 DUF1120 domain-containing protein [Pseudomonas sp. DC1.2]
MNKHLIVLTGALILSHTTPIFAASSVDLAVKGLITPNACLPTLSESGVIDHGKISAKDLNPANHTELLERTQQLSVFCEGLTTFSLYTIDNRAGSSTLGSFGLGLINSNQKLGAFAFRMINAVADGAPTTVLESADGSTWWDLLDDSQLPPGRYAGFGDKSTGAWAPIALKQVTVDLKLQTFIAGANNLDLTDEVLLDGSATLELKYL